MNKKELKELADAHFKYSLGIMELCVSQQMEFEQMMGLCEYLYTQSMIHGYKHCKDDIMTMLKDETRTRESIMEEIKSW